MTSRAAKAEKDAEAIVRLVRPPPRDEFTRIEVLIAEVRALPPNEPMPAAGYYSDEAAPIKRRNARNDAARRVAWDQLAEVMLSEPTLRAALVRAGL